MIGLTYKLGYRFLISSFLGSAIITQQVGLPAIGSLTIACGNTIETAAGAYFLLRFCGPKGVLESTPKLVKSFFFALLIPASLSAGIGILTYSALGLTDWVEFGEHFGIWFVGDTMGILVMLPLIIALFEGNLAHLFNAQSIFYYLNLVLLNVLLFTNPSGSEFLPFLLICVTLPLLVWPIYRYDHLKTLLALFLTCFIATVATSYGRGPFAIIVPEHALIMLQTFLGGISIFVLLSQAMLCEQRKITIKKVVAERRIQEKNQELNRVMEAVSNYLWSAEVTKDLVCHYRFISPSIAQITGRGPEFYLENSERWLSTIHEDDKGLITTYLEALISSNPPATFDLDYRIKLPDGKIRWIRDTITITKSKHGTIVLNCIASDITERKRTEQELITAKRAAEAANKAKTEFLANVSHEIRSPLTAISGFAEILREQFSDRKESLELIEKILRNSDTLNVLVNDILDLSKVESGIIEFEKIRFSFVQQIQDIVAPARHQANQKGIELNWETQTAIPRHIVSDPTRIRQILVNLIGNAIKFTNKGSVDVQVSYSPKPEPTICFIIKDSGCGIANDKKDQIFSPFVQADSSTTRKFGGTGLGLALSRRLAKALGGDVTLVESQPGKGSTFQFTFKAEVAEKATFERRFSSQLQKRSYHQGAAMLKDIKILLVEDNPDIQYLISRVLEKRGASVDIGTNGEDALKLTNQSSYDIILMDIQLPVLDGMTAMKRIRQHDTKTPIVAITANAMEDQKRLYQDEGFSECITKPINFQNLFTFIATCCKKKDAPVVQPSPVVQDIRAEGV